MHNYEPYTYCEYLLQCVQCLEKELQKLKTEQKILLEKIEGIKPVQIGTMEYKIHELSVHTLSGTLNLGLTANADEKTMQSIMEDIRKEGKFKVSLGDTEEEEDLAAFNSPSPDNA